MVKQAVKREVWASAQTGHLETWVGYAQSGLGRDPEREAGWRRVLAEVERDAPIRPGERALDIGCGLDSVLDFVPDVRGVTLDSLMREIARLGVNPALRHAAGMIEAMPFSAGSFDRVFCLNVLDHVQSPFAGLREIARVLRPSGWLVLSVDTYTGWRYVEKRLHKWWARVRGARTKHPWVFSNRNVARALRGAGLEPLAPRHVPGSKARRTLFLASKTA